MKEIFTLADVANQNPNVTSLLPRLEADPARFTSKIRGPDELTSADARRKPIGTLGSGPFKGGPAGPAI